MVVYGSCLLRASLMLSRSRHQVSPLGKTFELPRQAPDILWSVTGVQQIH